MPVPTSIDQLSTNAIDNSPQGTDTAKGTIDDYFRRHASFIAELRDRSGNIDGGLRAELAASGGAALVKTVQAGTGTVPRTVQDELRERISVRQFGVIGNGTANDTAAMQAALDARVPLFIPAGCWIKTSASLVYHPNQVITGPAASACGIIATGYAYPVFVTDTVAAADFVGGLFSGFTVRYGESAFKIDPKDGTATSSIASLCTWSDLRCEFQSTLGIDCRSMFIGNTLRNVVFFYCQQGIYTAKQANLNLFDACRWEGLDGISINFDCVTGFARGGENNLFLNARIEARNAAGMTGKQAVKLKKCYATQFIGGYVENTFTTVLYERGGSGTKFQGVWFTGQESDVAPAGFKPEVFDSDAIVIFDANRFLTGSRGAARMQIGGFNEGLETTDSTTYSVVSNAQLAFKTKSFPLANTVTKQFLAFTRASVSADINNQQTLCGRMTLSVFAATTNGTPVILAREYLVHVAGFAAGSMSAAFTLISSSDILNGSGATCTPGSASGPGGANAELRLSLTFGLADLNSCVAVVAFDVVQNFNQAFGAMNHITLV